MQIRQLLVTNPTLPVEEMLPATIQMDLIAAPQTWSLKTGKYYAQFWCNSGSSNPKVPSWIKMIVSLSIRGAISLSKGTLAPAAMVSQLWFFWSILLHQVTYERPENYRVPSPVVRRSPISWSLETLSSTSELCSTRIPITSGNFTDRFLNSDQALRIKTKSDATSASVSGVTYSGNTATGSKKFGVLIDQVKSLEIFVEVVNLTCLPELPKHPRYTGKWLHDLRKPLP